MKRSQHIAAFVVVVFVTCIAGFVYTAPSYAQHLVKGPIHHHPQENYTSMLASPVKASVATSLVVEYKAGATSAPGLQINPNLKILNTGGSDIALNHLVMRYWFTHDQSLHMQAFCDQAQIGCTNVAMTVKSLPLQPVAIAADSYIQVGFTSGVLKAGSDTGDIFLHAQDSTSSSPVIQTNDFSYNGNLTTYTAWPGISLYLNGQLVWGFEPFCGGALFSDCQTPLSMRTAFGLQPLTVRGFTGKGQTIVVVDSFGSPTLQQDVDFFSKTYGLPMGHLRVITPLPLPPFNYNDPDMVRWAIETTIDVENIRAIAPDANIVVLPSPVSETQGTIGFPQFMQLEQYAITNHLGSIFSQSWGASELTLTDQAGQALIKQYNDFYQQITLQDHVTVLNASGDNGATDAADLNGDLANVRTTSFPDDVPWVTSVGGVSLFKNQPLSAWQGSGGGVSSFFNEPDYQKALPASVQSILNGKRGVPDIAANADPATAMAAYFNGSWSMIGGTSASTPQWAGIVAIGNQMEGRPLGFLNPALYKLGTSPSAQDFFYDITSGNNDNPAAGVTGYPAVAGWDPVTGWGSPHLDFSRFLPELIAATP
ncbi:MAG TPA: cellulose binding domain-containing protein [Ktedonobacteraceae bacterium]|nr:cellulose binding domain-containing protein [Ktedonobacteraceae bacterium]